MIELHRTPDDAPGFVDFAERVVCGIVERDRPPRVYVVHIDRFFDWKWLRFRGKRVGAVGYWGVRENLGIPPFVPTRVLQQECFVLSSDGGSYESINADPLHVRIESAENIKRKVSRIAPDSALFWYSGKSQSTGTGALMGYVPGPEEPWTWYASFRADPTWEIAKAMDVTPDQLRTLAAPAPS
ncbi:MAG: hypothetical protein AAGD14_06205 [Planctomycetota bacterium]